MSKITVIYPGSFDPWTNGHLDLLVRAREIFPHIIVALAEQSSKHPLFTIAERLNMIRESTQKFGNVKVESFRGLLVNYARRQRASLILRGLRAVSDFEYEFQMALTNRKLSSLDKSSKPQPLETIYLTPDEKYTYLSSSTVKEIARLGGSVKDFVPENVYRALAKKFTLPMVASSGGRKLHAKIHL